jgi:hypothetical protein
VIGIGRGYPQFLLNNASRLDDDNAKLRSLFYPLYNKILLYWFPPTEGYDVAPYWDIPDSKKKKITFVILHGRHPLLLVDVKAPSDFKSDLKRRAAFKQVVQLLDEIGPRNQHADRLYAISAIGKRWRACYTLKGKGSGDGQPVNTVAEVSSFNSADEACWDPDITSDASFSALHSIVETVKGYAIHIAQ